MPLTVGVGAFFTQSPHGDSKRLDLRCHLRVVMMRAASLAAGCSLKRRWTEKHRTGIGLGFRV